MFTSNIVTIKWLASCWINDNIVIDKNDSRVIYKHEFWINDTFFLIHEWVSRAEIEHNGILSTILGELCHSSPT